MQHNGRAHGLVINPLIYYIMQEADYRYNVASGCDICGLVRSVRSRLLASYVQSPKCYDLGDRFISNYMYLISAFLLGNINKLKILTSLGNDFIDKNLCNVTQIKLAACNSWPSQNFECTEN